MQKEAEFAEVEPGLRAYELKSAVRKVSETAWQSGLMFAFQSTMHPYAQGFVFLSAHSNCTIAISARAAALERPLHFMNWVRTGTYEERDMFLQEVLRKTADLLQTPYADFVNDLASHDKHGSSIWRFQGWVDNKYNDRWRDNSSAWRALWGRVVEIVARGEPRLQVPAEVQQQVLMRLRSFAHEGQIVLDR